MSELWKSQATKAGEVFAEEQGVAALPVNPMRIAENLGMTVEALPSERKSVSGMLLESNNNFGIMYATYVNSLGFQHFCVGHELGHYILPGHYEQLMDSGCHESHGGFVSGDRHELEADHFSAGLLMPGFLFDPLLNKLNSGLKTIQLLAEECETSLTATAIRYAQKTPDPVAIIVSEGQTILYCFMSDEFKEIRGLTWIKKGKQVPRNTVTSRFNTAPQNILNCNQAEGDTTLLDWFESNLRYEVYEEVIGLGQYGKTLTVLSLEDVPDQEVLDEEEELVESWKPRFRR